MSDFDRPQNKFLEDMYDDFLWLISSEPDIFGSAAKKAKQLEYNIKNANKFNTIKSRKEYLERANNRHADKRKASTSYFNEDEPEMSKKTLKKATSKPKSENAKTDSKTSKTNDTKIEKKEEPTLSKEEIAAQNAIKLQEFYKKVEDLHLIEQSKLVLKKMIDYTRKYSEGIVKNYIPFNMRIYADNDETLYDIVNLIIDSFTYFGYMKNDVAVERSFYIVEDGTHITDLYNQAHSLVIFKDVAGLLNKDKITQDRLLKIWEKEIYDYSNLEGITTIISDINKEKIDELFANNSVLKNKVFDFELISTSANTQEIYHQVLNAFKKDYTVSGEFDVKLLDYITETFPKSQLTAPDYANSLIEQILFNQTNNVIEANSIPTYEKNKTIDEIFADLNSLIGLDNVKDMLQDLVSLMKFKSKTEGSLKLKDTNMHMVFLGNPGTGKTTVARMIAGILYNLKYIEQNKLIEVSAKDLIGQYVGQTAPKTISVIEKALGGVLFIDEAYSLASKPGSSGSSFNEECIATLIQAMENYRDNLVVIFAGYNKEMDAFLKSNSGIVSRIGYTMQFNDYTIDELIEILKSMFKKSGFFIDDGAIEAARKIIEEYRYDEGFGNARFVRNLYEKAIIKHAANTIDVTSKKALKTITADDITSDNLMKL